MSPAGRERALIALITAISLGTRVLLATRLELSDQEALLWAESVAWPGAAPPPLPALLVQLGTGWLGDRELGLRLPGILLSTLALLAISTLARDRLLAVALLAATPALAVGGIFASADLILASCWALLLAAAARERWVLAAGAGLAAFLCLPRDGELFAGGFDPGGLLVQALVWATPVLVGAALALWVRGPRGEREDALCWWGSLAPLVPALWGWPTWAAPSWGPVAAGIARREGALARAGWLGAGVAGLVSAAMLAHLLHPILALEDDPRARLTGGRTLAGSVAAWSAPLVFAEERADAALLAFYGVSNVWPLHGAARTVAHAERALFVRPWRGAATMEMEALGFDTTGPNTVSAYMDGTDPLRPRLAARWQVYEVFRPSAAAPEL